MRPFAVFMVLLCSFITGACTLKTDDSELATRTVNARPAWANYQEDIKAQIGATPVAQWQGTPRRAWQDSQGIHVQFVLKSPWDKRTCTIPVLIRDSGGTISQSIKGIIENNALTYTFPPSPLAVVSSASIEIKYPHDERRLVLETTPS